MTLQMIKGSAVRIASQLLTSSCMNRDCLMSFCTPRCIFFTVKHKKLFRATIRGILHSNAMQKIVTKSQETLMLPVSIICLKHWLDGNFKARFVSILWMIIKRVFHSHVIEVSCWCIKGLLMSCQLLIADMSSTRLLSMTALGCAHCAWYSSEFFLCRFLFFMYICTYVFLFFVYICTSLGIQKYPLAAYACTQ